WSGEFLRRTLPESVNKYLQRLGIGVKAPAAKPSTTDLRVRIDDLRASLSGVKLPKSDRWAKYYEESQTFDRLNDWNQKQLSVKQVLGEVSPRSLFDVCPSGGWYSLLAGSMGIRVVSSDVVREMMNQLYLTARNGERDVYPSVMDCCDRSPFRIRRTYLSFPATRKLFLCERNETA